MKSSASQLDYRLSVVRKIRMGQKRGKVVVAMSGGVDSSVAAALLLREGYEVIGAFMRLGSPSGVEEADSCSTTSGKHKQGCCSVLDAADAHRVAGMLDIPLYVLNFQEDFGRVIDYFVSEYNAGRTPNPCVRCNDWLKFGKLTQYAKAVGADFVASGHYARVGVDAATGLRCLQRGLDHAKDQSYVLFGISQDALQHTLLPIGEMTKPQVRQIAEEMKLPVFNKPDSQEICFVPDCDYAGLVQRRSPASFSEGELVDTAGNAIGHHCGHQHFTIGQRRGVGVALGYPIYVVDIDASTNRVTLGDRERLLKSRVMASDINIVHPDLAADPIRCSVKIRYNHQPQPATARVINQRDLHVTFDEPQSAITPGQALVVYRDDWLLGGGWIQQAE